MLLLESTEVRVLQAEPHIHRIADSRSACALEISFLGTGSGVCVQKEAIMGCRAP